MTQKKKNIVVLINLLHQFKEYNTDDYDEKIKIYFDEKIWSISSHRIQEIYGNKTDYFYSNETFVIMRGNILYKYKKSSFYEETKLFRSYNYIIGFGEDEINEGLN